VLIRRMDHSFVRLTRRQFGACALMSLVPASASFRLDAREVTLEAFLRAALQDVALPEDSAQLDLIHIKQSKTGAGVMDVSVVVRLTWSPGRRQGGFSAQGTSVEALAQQIVQDVRARLIPAPRWYS